MSKQTAPFWCSNAVATSSGWEDPITGELLICDNSLVLDKPVVKPVTETPKKKKKLFSEE
jgi:hypothetical protein